MHMTEWIDVGPEGSIEPGDHRLLEAGDTEVAVFNVDGRYFALENLCSHEEFPIAGGTIDDDCITCPLHDAEFDLHTGEALTPPAEDPIPTFPVRVQDGMIQVADRPNPVDG